MISDEQCASRSSRPSLPRSSVVSNLTKIESRLHVFRPLILNPLKSTSVTLVELCRPSASLILAKVHCFIHQTHQSSTNRIRKSVRARIRNSPSKDLPIRRSVQAINFTTTRHPNVPVQSLAAEPPSSKHYRIESAGLVHSEIQEDCGSSGVGENVEGLVAGLAVEEEPRQGMDRSALEHALRPPAALVVGLRGLKTNELKWVGLLTGGKGKEAARMSSGRQVPKRCAGFASGPPRGPETGNSLH